MKRRLKTLWARYAFLLATLMQPAVGFAAEPAGYPDQATAETAAVERAIAHLMASNPGARIMRDDAYRSDVTASIVGAGQAHDVPALLLTTIAFRESTFDDQATGARGELGITQIMPRWERVLGCDLRTMGGQVDCSARMLSTYRRTCGDWPGALTLYATGSGCSTGPRTTARIRSRIRQWAALEELR